MEDALNNRNQDIELAEDNNQQLLNLLEKYDAKLDELQEQAQLQDLQVLELQEKAGTEVPKIANETLECKIGFLKDMVVKLEKMKAESGVDYKPSDATPDKKLAENSSQHTKRSLKERRWQIN